LSANSSTPESSKAAITFTNVPTTPRDLPSLASMRWMVGNDTPARSANTCWSIPSRARAARICDAVIIVDTTKT
jgi:hypothetical protein